MQFFQITNARLTLLNEKWRTALNRIRGPIPLGLALSHMVAESNGNTDPTIRDTRRYPLGLMQIPRRIGRRYKYTETSLKISTNNLYVWSLKTLQDSSLIHQNYSWWTTAARDFWLAVRLHFILDHQPFTNLLTAAAAAGSSYKSTSGVQSWIRTQMEKTKRFGPFHYRDLINIARHLDEMRDAMQFIDGPDKASYAFTDAPALSPGSTINTLGTVGVFR